MYCRVIACDFDGTIATDGHLAPEAAAALARARSLGLTTILVSGRVLEDIRTRCPDRTLFDAIVAENGAVIWLPDEDRTIQLAPPPPERLLAALRGRGIPFHVGAVVIGTWDRHIGEVTDVVRQVGVDAQLVLNRSALMILPSGINKAIGVTRALGELGRSAHNVMAFGDAENDFPLLALAECGVAAAGAVAAVAAAADDRIVQPGGAGVARYIHKVLDAGGVVPTPARHRLLVGRAGDGSPISIPATGCNLLISGDPRSGKSWLGGLVAEGLLEQGYQACIFDPEGDYVGLGERPHVLILGQDLALPPPTVLPRLLRETGRSLVVTLGSLATGDRAGFVHAALGAIEMERARRGGTHWILVDEAQYFFGEGTPIRSHLTGGAGNFILLTYRPSLIAGAVCDLVQAHLISRTALEEERYFLTSLLHTCVPEDLNVADALAGLQMPRAGLLLRGAAGWSWQTFVPTSRRTMHVHHARKYVDTRLPEARAFRFLATGEGRSLVAHDLREFYAALGTLPAASWRHHLRNGDFSRWASDVLGDRQLAASLQKLERTAASGVNVERRDILTRIETEYGLGRRV